MACFIVPAAEAVVTTAAAKLTKGKISESMTHKLGWLNRMLWGGSALLAFEHVWHGELIPVFPFLTNAANPVDLAEMFSEMATSGVGMAVLVTGVWGVMAAVSHHLEKKARFLPDAEAQT